MATLGNKQTDRQPARETHITGASLHR